MVQEQQQKLSQGLDKLQATLTTYKAPRMPWQRDRKWSDWFQGIFLLLDSVTLLLLESLVRLPLQAVMILSLKSVILLLIDSVILLLPLASVMILPLKSAILLLLESVSGGAYLGSKDRQTDRQTDR